MRRSNNPAIPIGRHDSEPVKVIRDGSKRKTLPALLLNDLDHLREQENGYGLPGEV